MSNIHLSNPWVSTASTTTIALNSVTDALSRMARTFESPATRIARRQNAYERLHTLNRPQFTDEMNRVLYIIRMGWHRWSHRARVKWVKELLAESERTATWCREWLTDPEVHKHHVLGGR